MWFKVRTFVNIMHVISPCSCLPLPYPTPVIQYIYRIAHPQFHLLVSAVPSASLAALSSRLTSPNV